MNFKHQHGRLYLVMSLALKENDVLHYDWFVFTLKEACLILSCVLFPHISACIYLLFI